MLNLMSNKLVLTGAVLGLASGPAFACDSYDAVVAAVQSDNRAEALRLYDVISADDGCDEAIRGWTGTYLAREYFRDAMDPAASVGERRRALDASLALETHWRTMAELGRLEWTEKNYGAAAGHLAKALSEIAEGNQAHDVSSVEIERLRRLYTSALALDDDVVASAETGSELFRTTYRGFKVEETPLPITFVFDSTEFDAQGRIYADALLNHLLTHNPPRIELDGHTDPMGSEEYNLDLSLARADAVRQHLVRGGYRGEIVVRGFGEQKLPEPPVGVAAGSEEHHRIARRVAFRAG
jgi:outer membrane protein OmpA-like peptidoglycan-associated protein